MERSQRSLPPKTPRVEPPRSDRYHLETDASLNRALTRRADESGHPLYRAGGGIVLRDLSMKPFEEHAVDLGYLRSPSQAECASLHWGLRRALHLRIWRLRVRNDNLPLMLALSRAVVEPEFRVPTDLSSAVETARRFESIQFRWSKSTHSKERGDGAHSADFLARRACGLGPR